MKAIILLLSLLPVVAMAYTTYPDNTRFVEYSVGGTAAYVLVDTKTGCEYIRASVGSGTAYTFVQGSCTAQEPKK